LGDTRRFKQLGGHVAIDFVNTLGGRPDHPDDEYLHNYTDLIEWTERVGLRQRSGAAQLGAVTDRNPQAAQAALEQAKRLRESLDCVLRCRTEPRLDGCPEDVGAVQAAYLSAIAHASPQLTVKGLQWTWPDDTDQLEQPIWPIAVAAVDLLQKAPLHLLTRCQHCRWLFLDTSRQHNRRWCSMSGCGAIVKMRRYRASRQS
jgi:predicted RNA-binding Zn ribbon-like protein